MNGSKCPPCDKACEQGRRCPAERDINLIPVLALTVGVTLGLVALLALVAWRLA